MKSKIFYFILALALFFISLLFVLDIEEEKRVLEVSVKPLPKVSIIKVKAKKRNASIYATSILEPKEEVHLYSLVTGEIVYKSKKLLEGSYVKRGEKLLSIDKSAYVVALNQAKYNLNEAKFGHLQEEKKHLQALKDWQRLEGKHNRNNPSDLALNIPQLKLAKSNLLLAKSRVKEAKKMLLKSTIKAPISGFISNNEVEHKNYLNQGEMLFQIKSNKRLKGSIHLSIQEWMLLNVAWKSQEVKIKNLRQGSETKIHLTHGGRYLESNLVKFYFTLSNKNFVVGDFVEIELATKAFANSLEVPLSAVTPNGMVWYVDVKNRLQRFKAQRLLYKKQTVIVKIPTSKIAKSVPETAWKIALIPLSTFYQGMRVLPREEQ